MKLKSNVNRLQIFLQFTFPCEPDRSHGNDNDIVKYVRKLKLTQLLERCGGLDEAVPWNV